MFSPIVRRFSTLLAFAAIAATSGCSSGSISKLLSIPTPMPSPVVSVTPQTLVLSLSHQTTGLVTASESGTSGFFSAQTGDASKVTVTTVTGQSNVFQATAVGLGSTKIVVSDGQGGSATVTVTVNS